MSEQERRDRLEIIADLVASRKHIYDLEAEIKELRGFAKYVIDKHAICNVYAQEFGFIDENGNPTKLLTG